MTFDLDRWRPAALAPSSARPGLLALLAVMALAFLLGLAAIAGMAAGRAAAPWAGRLGGAATVVVWGAGLETPDAAAARALDRLSHVAGVAAARPLEPDPLDGATASLIAPPPHGAVSDPRLIAVTTASGATVTGAELQRALRADGIATAVDDHRWRSSGLTRILAAALLAAAVFVAAMLGLGVAAMALAARGCLRRVGDRVEMFTISGASHGFIYDLLQVRLVAAIALASGAGALLAILVAVGWRLTGSADLGWRLPVHPAMAWLDLVAAAPWPLLFVVLGLPATRLAIGSTLKRAG